MFAPGERPTAAALSRLAEGNSGFSISFAPSAETGRGDWLELLANGLTFDLEGLAPGPAASAPPRAHDLGFAETLAANMQAITLKPAPHIASGGRMQPVVRSLARLAAELTTLPRVRAVAWHPAHTWCEPEMFRAAVLRWTDGGVFPGLGLAAFAPMPDGGMQSQGLALFTGQELRLEPDLAGDRAAAVKIGLRLLHWLVENGRLEAPESLTGPDGEPLRLEPSANGRFVRVWKS